MIPTHGESLCVWLLAISTWAGTKAVLPKVGFNVCRSGQVEEIWVIYQAWLVCILHNLNQAWECEDATGKQGSETLAWLDSARLWEPSWDREHGNSTNGRARRGAFPELVCKLCSELGLWVEGQFRRAIHLGNSLDRADERAQQPSWTVENEEGLKCSGGWAGEKAP